MYSVRLIGGSQLANIRRQARDKRSIFFHFLQSALPPPTNFVPPPPQILCPPPHKFCG